LKGPAVLVLIPARGGSKGIPRKNLRTLGGRPLLSYSVRTALASRHRPDVVVTSEDPEILALARQLGARPLERASHLSGDRSTLDEVVVAAVEALARSRRPRPDIVVTIQPTSPLLTPASLDEAIDRLVADPSLETVLSVAQDRHLRWTRVAGGFAPAYRVRVNRQELPETFRETGGIIACRAAVLASGTRIGGKVAPLVLSGGEAVDIDTPQDWAVCEWYLSTRDVLFVVAGYSEIGLGHVHNALTVANELVRHRVRFLVTQGSELARDLIAARNYEVHLQATDDLAGEILTLGPDTVINDRLDTTSSEIRRLKAAGIKVVNFEDLGDGATEADLVFNAIYPEQQALPNHYYGGSYFCIRHEFVMTQPRPVVDSVTRVLVTFGGVDPNNLTRKVLEAVYDECRARGVAIEVVAGRGYEAFGTLADFPDAEVVRSAPDMAARIRAADIVFTSAGRTIFEVACLGSPAIVLAQNERELTHLFASEENGFRHLGLGTGVQLAAIRAAFVALADDLGLRQRMQARMLDNDLRAGTARVIGLIEGVIGRE
jgi:CMP-N-acetylneuraminic acid synthetase